MVMSETHLDQFDHDEIRSEVTKLCVKMKPTELGHLAAVMSEMAVQIRRAAESIDSQPRDLRRRAG